MKLFSWNVNGIRAVLNKGELQKFIAAYDPDILCLQETKANRDQVSLDFPAYSIHFNGAVRKGYSGTALLSKQPPRKVVDNIPEHIAEQYNLVDQYGDANQEGRVIAAEFADFWVVTAYTPNAKGDLSRLPLREQWDQAMIAYCRELAAAKPVLYNGDMNVAHQPIDLAHPKANDGKKGFTREERHGFDEWLAAGFVDTFRAANPDTTDAYTWWTAWGGARERNVGWRIDYWLASESIAGHTSNPSIIASQMGSDHCPVGVEV